MAWERGVVEKVTTARITGKHGAVILSEDGKKRSVNCFQFPQEAKVGDGVKYFAWGNNGREITDMIILGE